MATKTGGRFVSHLAAIGAIVTFVVFCMFYPCLPGGYDALAPGLSAMAQTLGIVGLLLVPAGVLWLVYESRSGRKERRYDFALVSVIASSIMALAVSISALASAGLALGGGTLVLWTWVGRRIFPVLKRLKGTGGDDFNPAPLYLFFIPGIAFLAQAGLAAPVTEWSRNRAIANSATLIDDIEAYHAAHGEYPESLGGLHPDYKPQVVGIRQFHYVPADGTYNLSFEQPIVSLAALGTRELVVYNPLDKHLALSHAAWNLTRRPEDLADRQGWYVVRDTTKPHWKYFRFD